MDIAVDSEAVRFNSLMVSFNNEAVKDSTHQRQLSVNVKKVIIIL